MLTTPLDAAEFFSGIGGFTEGFNRAGIRTVCLTERDPTCRQVLTRHYPDIPLMEDIKDVRGTDIVGGVDLFAGGFPCQDTTYAAPHRAGLAGERSGHFHEFTRLVGEYARLVDVHRPRWVVIENPDGLLTSPDRTGRDMATVVGTLGELGYGWAYRVVDGNYLGTPQRRRRVLIVGHRGGDPRPAWQVLGDPRPGAEAVAPCDDGRPEPGPGAGAIVAGGSVVRLWRKRSNSQVNISFGYEGGYRETWGSDDRTNTLTGFDGSSPIRAKYLLAQHGRMRTITYLEKERLQGFPDGWTDGTRTSDLRRNKVLIAAGRDTILGNAIHVGTAAWLGRRIAAVHQAVPMLKEAS